MSPTELQPVDTARRRLAIAVGGFPLAAVSLIGALHGKDGGPYVWMDVALVSLLCAVPFSAALADRVAQSVSRWACLFTAALLLVAAPGLLTTGVAAGLHDQIPQSAWTLAAVRLLLSAAACTGGSLFVAALYRESRSVSARPDLDPPNRADLPVLAHQGPDGPSGPTFARTRLSYFLILLTIAGGVSETYVEARCRREQERMREFAASRRIVDALEIARPLAKVRPNGVVAVGEASQPVLLGDYISHLESEAAALESLLARLSTEDGADASLQRASCLAQLSRIAEATSELRAVADNGSPQQRTEAFLLLGTIEESSERWESALAWYRKAFDLATTSKSRADALRGVGFASRKLGRYRDAESAYESMLLLRPTADSHFLLAQFYEDVQQGERARQHAQKAIQLAPRQFREPGEALIDRVVTQQFGCFTAFQKQRR